MKESLKKYWWIPVLILLAGAGTWAYFYFRNPKNLIKFGFRSQNDLGNLLSTIESRYANRSTEKGIGIYLDVPLTTIIKNKDAREITLNNISGMLSYEGENIFQTKGDSKALKNVKVAGKSETPVTDTFQILINGKTIKFLKELVKGNKPKLNYDLTAMAFGDAYHFGGTSIMNETIPPTGSNEPTGGRG